MSEILSSVPDWLVRTTVLIAIGAVVVQCLVRFGQVRSAWLHRVGWMFVLLQGLFFLQWSLEIPWYESAEAGVLDAPAWHIVSDGNSVALDVANAGTGESNDRAVASTSLPFTVDLSQWLRFLWLSGIAVVASVGVGSYALLLFVLRRTKSAPRPWQGEWNRLLRQAGVKQQVQLLVSNQLGPMLCLRPTGYCVVVPESQWEKFSSSQRIGILRHELAHLQRGDVWKSLLVRVIASVHWFNPLAWLAVRRFEETAEWACDQRLADSDPCSVPDYARALLQLVAPASHGVGVSAARGASVSIRLRRLLSFQDSGDSLMKRTAFTLVLVLLCAVGLLRVHLVAQEREAENRNDVATEKRVDEFVNKVIGDDELVENFRRVAKTPAGRIVLADRATYFVDQKEEQARAEAGSAYFASHFQRDGETVRLKPGQEGFRDKLLRTAKEVNGDLGKIKPVLAKIAKQIDPQTELDRLVMRFFNHEASAAFIYMQELRDRLHPDERAIEYTLSKLLVKDVDGSYTVRPARRAEAEEMLKTGRQLAKAHGEIRSELTDYADEVATPDDLNKQLKQTMGEPLFASFIAAELMGEGQGNARQRIDRFFENLDELFVDTADGLVVNGEQLEELKEVLGRYNQVKIATASLRKPLDAVASAIKPVDDLHKGWRELLKSDVALIKIAGETEGIGDASVEEVIRDLLNEVLQEGDDGRLQVNASMAEDINEVVQGGFRGYRNMRRKARTIDTLAKELEDKELAEVLGTTGGKLFILTAIKKSIEAMAFDGFNAWVEEHFEQVDNGWKLKREATEEVEEIVAQAREIEQELEKDDF